MTLDELGKVIEMEDYEEVIYCFVDNEKLIATFTTRKDLEVEVLTPYENKLFKQGQFTQDDIIRKVFELKTIANQQ